MEAMELAIAPGSRRTQKTQKIQGIKTSTLAVITQNLDPAPSTPRQPSRKITPRQDIVKKVVEPRSLVFPQTRKKSQSQEGS